MNYFKAVLVSLALMVCIHVVFAQDIDQHHPKLPTATEVNQLKAKLLVTQKELLVAKYQALQATFDAQTSALDIQFKQTDSDLQALLATIYVEAHTTPSDYVFEPKLGTFQPAPKPKAQDEK